jgi:hypothetical protein
MGKAPRLLIGGPLVAIGLDFFRGKWQMTLRRGLLSMRRMGLAAAVLLGASHLPAQYPGQVAKSSKEAPELRSIAILEWTGEAGKPKKSRLVPVADGARLQGDQLQDGGIYLARPVPLALAGAVEYELQQNGKPMGLFDLKNAGQEMGAWVGFGAWKPLPKPKPSKPEQIKIDDEGSDRPVLHRKHHAEDSRAPDSGSDSGSASSAPAADPDRPTLHKKETSSDTTDASTAPPDDPDRPVLKKSSKKPPEDTAYVDSLPGVTDPDRPRLKRGKSSGDGAELIPTLMGLPPDMQQAVAVSDATIRPEHTWSYSWANPGDEAKMKSALEAIARDALGLNPPPTPPAPAPKKSATRKKAKPAPPLPAPLLDEQFRAFELAYNSGATLVLTARTDGPLAQQKFVTLIAQPDLYGNVLVLLKNVAAGAHLDETPRMRLVDAVDAMADNRGELLFELRGATQRQFALYRVLRGQAEKLFVSGGGSFGSAGRE